MEAYEHIKPNHVLRAKQLIESFTPLRDEDATAKQDNHALVLYGLSGQKAAPPAYKYRANQNNADDRRSKSAQALPFNI